MSKWEVIFGVYAYLREPLGFFNKRNIFKSFWNQRPPYSVPLKRLDTI